MPVTARLGRLGHPVRLALVLGLVGISAACGVGDGSTAPHEETSWRMTQQAEQDIPRVAAMLTNAARARDLVGSVDGVRRWMADPFVLYGYFRDPGAAEGLTTRRWSPNDDGLPYWEVLSATEHPSGVDFVIAGHAYGGFDDNAFDFFGPGHATWGRACAMISVIVDGPATTATSESVECPEGTPDIATR